MSRSTVHKYKDVYWFWDETKKPRKRIGSYISRVGAQKGLEDWIESHRIRSGKTDNKSIIDELSELDNQDKNDDYESKCTCLDEINIQCSHCQEIIYNL